MVARRWLIVSLAFVAACSSSASSGTAASDAGGDAGSSQALPEAAPGSSILHGTMVDYQTLKPVGGLTITSGDSTTTTDATGAWLLTVPTGSPLQLGVTNATYSRLALPDMVAKDGDVDMSAIVIPDTSTFSLAKDVLKGFDDTKALVWLVISTRPSCASPVGGTVTLTSPAGGAVAYFGTAALPMASVTTFQAVAAGRPVAALYNLDTAGSLAFTIDHPTCKMAAYPVEYTGRTYSGTARLDAAQDGHNSAVVAVLE
jgi:hypothetical protein